MKKFKKIAALILAGAMVLGMSTTAFAAPKETATITVNDAAYATLSYLQVIEPKTTTATGWDFTSAAVATDYKTAFGIADVADSDTDEQTAIAMLIKSVTQTIPDGAPSIVKTATAASATQINQALDNVMNGEAFAAMSNPLTVNEAGVYAVKATESGYTYKAMAAYVGFDTVTVDNTTYEYPSLKDAELTTKKIPTDITKADNDNNDAVAINQTVTYTVTTAFPYFNQNEVNKVFKISDTITGAEYVGLVDDATTAEENEKTATVKIGDTFVTNDVDFVQNGNSFEIDLSDYVDNANSNAGKTVVVTYQAVVKAVEVQNTASSHINDVVTNSDPINLYTGKITLTKVDAENNEVKLANAGFEVSLGDTVLTFVQKDAAAKVYTYDPAGTITQVFTDANGQVVVEGLDIGTYTFTEKTAPTGYSINETPLEVVLDITDEGEAVDGNAVKIFEDAGSIADTKLLALPSTGGIGTTIFTIGGVAIILAAAAMLFARKRVAR